MNGASNINFFCPAPWGPGGGGGGGGRKVKYHLFSITKSISKIFIPNFWCVLTNERYKTYQTGFLFCRLGHVLGVGLGGTGGAQGVKKLFWQRPLGPWGGVKRSNII